MELKRVHRKKKYETPERFQLIRMRMSSKKQIYFMDHNTIPASIFDHIYYVIFTCFKFKWHLFRFVALDILWRWFKDISITNKSINILILSWPWWCLYSNGCSIGHHIVLVINKVENRQLVVKCIMFSINFSIYFLFYWNSTFFPDKL